MANETELSALAVIALAIAGFTMPSASADELPSTVTVLVVGDVGLNRADLKVFGDGVHEGNSVLSWAEMTKGIAPLVNADINFMNLETVVTEDNTLRKTNKNQKHPYMFRTHPKGVAHLLDLGFNLVSLANNHSFDYGKEGVRDTLRYMAELTKGRKVAYAGLGLNRADAARPTFLDVGGEPLAFSAVGAITNKIAAHRAGPNKPGTLGFRFEDDWDLAVKNLSETESPLKIMSVHYGRERNIRADERQKTQFGQAVSAGVDLVVGHHAHVARGIELRNGKVIFYGLGNFLIRGARDMGSSPKLAICCDYGIASKLYFTIQADGRYGIRAIEVFPLTDMHRSPKLRRGEDGRKRIMVLNALAKDLDDKKTGAVGVRFTARKDGSGLFCVPGAWKDDGIVSKICPKKSRKTKPSRDVLRKVRRAPRR